MHLMQLNIIFENGPIIIAMSDTLSFKYFISGTLLTSE